MSLLHTATPENATGQVKEIYDQITAAFGHVPNALQTHSTSPVQLAKQWQTIDYYMQHPHLSFNLLAMLRMLISEKTGCHYCVGFNAAMLVNMGGISIEQIAATKQDPQNAPLPAGELAMLLFVLRATQGTPATADDIAQLEAAGWNDTDIYDALAHGASMVATDIIFNTLGIDNDF
jgi:hypothetical protein